MKFFSKYQKIILRSIGAVMILVGFAINFWSTPKKGFTKEELAAANVARMEASVLGKSSVSTRVAKSDNTPFFQELKNTQDKQMDYIIILIMITGAGFLIYSFIKKDESLL